MTNWVFLNKLFVTIFKIAKEKEMGNLMKWHFKNSKF